MISIKQLKYALAVEKTLHLKNAAELCSISQSALSTALSELEKQLGVQIFERDNKKVLVTPLGSEILKKANEIMINVHDLEKIADRDKSPLNSTLSIGMIPTIGPYILPLCLPALNEQYPNLQLQLTEEQSHLLVDKVRRGTIDTAILALPYPCDGLLTFTFCEEELFLICHKDDEPKEQENINNDNLQQSKLMLLKDGHCLKDHALSACKIAQNTTHSFSATSLTTLVELVAGKIGTTLVPEIALPQLVANRPDLCAIKLKEKGPHRSLAFIVRPNYPALNNIERLISLFKQEIEGIKI